MSVYNDSHVLLNLFIVVIPLWRSDETKSKQLTLSIPVRCHFHYC